MVSKDYIKVRNAPIVKTAYAQYRHAYADWMRQGNARGYSAYQTPLHMAEYELNLAIETALLR